MHSHNKKNNILLYQTGEGHVFGDDICHEPTVGQSAVDVYALTYCDMHCIYREALLEVLEFYPEFALKFASTLNLSYNLRDEVRFPSLGLLWHNYLSLLTLLSLGFLGSVYHWGKALDFKA